LSDKNIRTKVLQAVTICNSKLKLRVSKTRWILGFSPSKKFFIGQ